MKIITLTKDNPKTIGKYYFDNKKRVKMVIEHFDKFERIRERSTETKDSEVYEWFEYNDNNLISTYINSNGFKIDYTYDNGHVSAIRTSPLTEPLYKYIIDAKYGIK